MAPQAQLYTLVRPCLDVARYSDDDTQRGVAVVSAQLIAADLDKWFAWSCIDAVLSPREGGVARAALSGGSSKETAVE